MSCIGGAAGGSMTRRVTVLELQTVEWEVKCDAAVRGPRRKTSENHYGPCHLLHRWPLVLNLIPFSTPCLISGSYLKRQTLALFGQQAGKEIEEEEGKRGRNKYTVYKRTHSPTLAQQPQWFWTCWRHVITDTSDLINWKEEQDVTAYFLFGYSDLL